MRELAQWDVDRYEAVARWPLREALLAYVALLKRDARDAYEHARNRYMHGRYMQSAPELPGILKD